MEIWPHFSTQTHKYLSTIHVSALFPQQLQAGTEFSLPLGCTVTSHRCLWISVSHLWIYPCLWALASSLYISSACIFSVHTSYKVHSDIQHLLTFNWSLCTRKVVRHLLIMCDDDPVTKRAISLHWGCLKSWNLWLCACVFICDLFVSISEANFSFAIFIRKW